MKFELESSIYDGVEICHGYAKELSPFDISIKQKVQKNTIGNLKYNVFINTIFIEFQNDEKFKQFLSEFSGFIITIKENVINIE